MSLLAYILVVSLAVFYISLVLLFFEKDSHFGPFASSDKKLVYIRRNADGDVISRHEQPINLFDRIRWFFGVYKVVKEELDESLSAYEGELETKEVWLVNPLRMELWECPICLSAWVAIIPAIWGLSQFTLSECVLVWAAASGLSVLMHRFVSGDGTTEMSFEFIGENNDGSNK